METNVEVYGEETEETVSLSDLITAAIRKRFANKSKVKKIIIFSDDGDVNGNLIRLGKIEKKDEVAVVSSGPIRPALEEYLVDKGIGIYHDVEDLLCGI